MPGGVITLFLMTIDIIQYILGYRQVQHTGHTGACQVQPTFFAKLPVFVKDVLPDLAVVPSGVPKSKNVLTAHC